VKCVPGEPVRTGNGQRIALAIEDLAALVGLVPDESVSLVADAAFDCRLCGFV